MKENKLKLIRMSDVELQLVDWLWYPFIPFGKITMIQGDPGEGKTTLALRLAAACSSGSALPGMEPHEPFTVTVSDSGRWPRRYHQAAPERCGSK